MGGRKKKCGWICGIDPGLDQDDGGRLPHRIRQSWSFARNHDNRNIDRTNKRQNLEGYPPKVGVIGEWGHVAVPLCRSSLDESKDTRTYNTRQ